jgi:hypothetical protein
MWGKIKIRRTDSIFSVYLRQKRGWRCEKCGGFWPQGKGLTVSHYWSRAKESVRFDEENCDILCVACHFYFETHKTEYEAWKKERMGLKPFNLLMVRAHITGKRDDKAVLMVLKELVRKQNNHQL